MQHLYKQRNPSSKSTTPKTKEKASLVLTLLVQPKEHNTKPFDKNGWYPKHPFRLPTRPAGSCTSTSDSILSRDCAPCHSHTTVPPHDLCHDPRNDPWGRDNTRRRSSKHYPCDRFSCGGVSGDLLFLGHQETSLFSV